MKDCDLISNMDFNGSNAEKHLYYALKYDNADKGWFIVHSLLLKEGEADFLILDKDLGILLIELKDGKKHTRDGKILCENGDPVDPLEQLDRCKRSVESYLKGLRRNGFLGSDDKAEICRCVWLPDSEPLEGINEGGAAWLYEPLLGFDPLKNDNIRREMVADQNVQHKVFESWRKMVTPGGTSLSDSALDALKAVFNPHRTVSRTVNWLWKRKTSVSEDLCMRQNALLGLLEHQRRVIVEGGAGTGKTVLALEKAYRLAYRGDGGDVAVICFNDMLRDYMAEDFAKKYDPERRVRFVNLYREYGVDVDIFDHPQQEIAKKIRELGDGCGLRHVIIDEAQDFGADVLQALFEASDAAGGAFYVFCDLKQCVQKSEPSVWLNEKHPGMVRVELTHNLRNTREIAVSASGPVELPEEYCDTELKGPAPRVYISEPEEKFVKVAEILADYRNRGIDPDNTIILTMLGWKNYQKKDTIDIGDIKLRRVSGKDYCVSGNVLFTTARKFKGLEANHIIIIDLTERHLERDRELIYTAMSRSCMYLDVILSSKTKDPNFLRKAAAEWQLESVGL